MLAGRRLLFARGVLHRPAPRAENPFAHTFGEGGEDGVVAGQTRQRVREAVLRPFDSRQVDQLEHVRVRIRKHKVGEIRARVSFSSDFKLEANRANYGRSSRSRVWRHLDQKSHRRSENSNSINFENLKRNVKYFLEFLTRKQETAFCFAQPTRGK